MEVYTLVLLGFIVIVLLNKLKNFQCSSEVCMVGKTILITGGASGIGFEAALVLASKGARIIIADVVPLSKIIEKAKKLTHNPNIIGKHLDLCSFTSIRKFARELKDQENKLDVLICNAGIGNSNLIKTEDGLDKTLQTNYFGHFLLTHLLLALLKSSSPSRIICTSSILAYFGELSLEALTPRNPSAHYLYLRFGAYGTSKLGVAMMTKVLAEKLKPSNVTVNCLCPGGTRTGIFFTNLKSMTDLYAVVIGLITWCYGRSPRDGAQTIVHLAQANEVQEVTGGFFHDGRKFFHPYQLNDEKLCELVWQRTIELTKLLPHEIKY